VEKWKGLVGRRLDLDSPEGRAYAQQHGVSVDFGPFGPIGNTPPQDHISDPYIVDPRPIRSLSEEQRKVIRYFALRGAYAAVAGFETWRGQDRWLYVDVLGVGKDSNEAETKGMPVGPIERCPERRHGAGGARRMVRRARGEGPHRSAPGRTPRRSGGAAARGMGEAQVRHGHLG
jgi:hypothetical protein